MVLWSVFANQESNIAQGCNLRPAVALQQTARRHAVLHSMFFGGHDFCARCREWMYCVLMRVLQSNILGSSGATAKDGMANLGAVTLEHLVFVVSTSKSLSFSIPLTK